MLKSKKYTNFDARTWAEDVPGLKTGPRKLLDFLAGRSSPSGLSWYSQARMAEAIGCVPKTVYNHLEGLKSRGLVQVFKHGEDGRRARNIYLLIGWPGRKPLPPEGLLVRGRRIKETFASRLATLEIRQNFPIDAAKFTEGMNEKEINKSFYEKTVLHRCFKALGKLATPRNKVLLKNDLPSLMQILDEGVDLDRQLIPKLQAAGLSAKTIPEIRTWRYFLVSQKQGTGEPVAKTALDQPNQGAVVRKDEQGAILTEMLRSVVKAGRMTIDPRLL